MQKGYCSVHYSEFQNLEEACKDWLGEALTESVKFLLADPP